MGEMQIILDTNGNLFLVVTDKENRVIGVFAFGATLNAEATPKIDCWDRTDSYTYWSLEDFGFVFLGILIGGTQEVTNLSGNLRFSSDGFIRRCASGALGNDCCLEQKNIDKLENWFPTETSVKQDCCRVLLKVKIADNLSRAELAAALKNEAPIADELSRAELAAVLKHIRQGS